MPAVHSDSGRSANDDIGCTHDVHRRGVFENQQLIHDRLMSDYEVTLVNDNSASLTY